MTHEYNQKAIDRLTRLKFTSSTTDKKLIKTFNISAYRLTMWKKGFRVEELTSTDWIYGALRSRPGLKTVDEIEDYIDYKNRDRLSDKVVRRGLDKLNSEGHAYKEKGRWNYTQRLIEVYSIKTDRFVTEVELGHFDLEKLKKIFKPKRWDYLMYEGFDISREQSTIFRGIVSIDFNFDRYSYDLTCRQGE